MTTINPYLPPSFYDSSGNLTVSQSVADSVAAGIQARVESMPPAQRDLFLALLASSDIAPSGGQPPADLDASLDRLEAAAAALLSLASLANNSIDLLARVMVEQAAEQRKNALEDRLTAREAAKTELMSQAGKLKEAADKMIAGAIAQLVLTVVFAVAQAVLSVVAIGKAGTAAGSAKGGDQGLSSAQNTAAGGFSGLGGAAGSIGGAMGNVASTWAQADAKNIEAEGSIDAAEAQEAQAAADIKKEIQQGLDDLIKAIINFLKELKEAQVNQMQSLTKL